jgi:hypothetical protein
VNEAAACRLLAVVLSSELKSMLRASSLADDAILLARLQEVSEGSTQGAGAGLADVEGKVLASGDMPNLATCIAYRMQRKEMLAAALERQLLASKHSKVP